MTYPRIRNLREDADLTNKKNQKPNDRKRLPVVWFFFY